MRKIPTSAFAVWLSVCFSVAAGAEDRASILSKLTQMDAIWRSGGTLTYSLLDALPFSRNGETERLLFHGALTGVGGKWASVGRIDPATQAPAYQPPGASKNVGDACFDAVGTLQLWRITYFATLNEEGYVGQFHRIASVEVSPGGVIRDDTKLPFDAQAAAVELDDHFGSIQRKEIYMPLLCSGRGYSLLLRDILSVEDGREDGLVVCEAVGADPGSPDQDHTILWRLCIDPDAGYLVRHAECRSESDPDRVFMEISNNGTLWGDSGALPTNGLFSIHPGVAPLERSSYEFTFGTLNSGTDEAVFSEARDALRAEWEEGTMLTDRRSKTEDNRTRVVGIPLPPLCK
jgi:hypothetical protein